MTSTKPTNTEVAQEQHHGGHHHPPTTWKTYFTFSTDHKVIGIQYIVTAFVFFLVGGIFAMIIR
ncbi:MAG: cytochrome c oxidase subunit I, partial [Cyanobacteria bacterium P01_H01_bin.150]